MADRPATAEALTPAWLMAHLPEAGRIHGFTLADAAGGIAVTSRVHRILLESDGPLDSVVIKLPNPAWTHGTALHQREHRVYASGLELPRPRCFHSEADDEGFVFLLEDLSEADPGHRMEGYSLDETRRVLSTIARFHARFGAGIPGWPEKTWPPARGQQIADGLASAWPILRDDPRFAVPDGLPEAVQAALTAVRTRLPALNDAHHTFVHSDLHAENVLLDRDRVVALDWQNGGNGCAAIDVAAVLFCARPEVLAEYFEDLVVHYHVAAELEIPIVEEVRLAMQWNFAGVSQWLVRFEAESLRDTSTVMGHWTRLSSGLTCIQ